MPLQQQSNRSFRGLLVVTESGQVDRVVQTMADRPEWMLRSVPQVALRVPFQFAIKIANREWSELLVPNIVATARSGTRALSCNVKLLSTTIDKLSCPIPQPCHALPDGSTLDHATVVLLGQLGL